MPELRNEPSAPSANSGTVIMVEPGRMLMHHSRPRRSGRQGERTADNGRPMTDGGRGKRPAMDGGAWIAAKTVSRRLSPVACFVVVLAFAFPAFAVPCRSGSVESWLESFKPDAPAGGNRPRALSLDADV